MNEGPTSVEPVVIVGGGHAGLCVADAVNRRGIQPVLLDGAGRAGTSWRRRYLSLHLNTDRASSAVPGVPPPRSMSRWPDAREWADYLARVEQTLGLDRRTVSVRSVATNSPTHLGPPWCIETDQGLIEAANIVVATGRDRCPSTPRWPGDDGTGIRVEHASSFQAAEDFRDQRVLVVGSGNSATEIAHLLTSHAKWVGISMRTLPLFVRREMFGVSVTQWGRMAKRLPGPLVEKAMGVLQRMQFGDLESIDLGPADVGVADIANTQGPTVDSGFIGSVRLGRIEVLPDLERFETETIAFVDGEQRSVDVVLAATGYRTGLEELVPHAVLDDRGFPLVDEPPFEAAPGLFFAGFGPATLTAFMPDFVAQAPAIADAIVSRL